MFFPDPDDIKDPIQEQLFGMVIALCAFIFAYSIAQLFGR
jgi:hypothetical protein